MRVLEALKYPANPQGLRDLADVIESKYPGCKVTYMSSYGNVMDVTIEMPLGTEVIIPQLVDMSGQVEA